jgi:hypothetical protein
MPVPHGNDPPRAIAWRPNHYDETRPEPADGDEAGLTIVTPIVAASEIFASEDQFGIGEVQTTLDERDSTLGFVPCVHGLMYLQKPVRQDF